MTGIATGAWQDSTLSCHFCHWWPAERAHDDCMPNSLASMPETSPPVLSWIALGVVYVVWGSTYLAIRVGVGHLPPLLMAGHPLRRARDPALPGRAPRRRQGRRGSGQSRRRVRPGAQAWLAAAVVGALLLFAGNGGVTCRGDEAALGLRGRACGDGPAVGHRLRPVRCRGSRSREVRSCPGRGAGRRGGPGRRWRQRPDTPSDVVILLGAAAAWGLGISAEPPARPCRATPCSPRPSRCWPGGVILLAVAAATGEFSRVQLGLRFPRHPGSHWPT